MKVHLESTHSKSDIDPSIKRAVAHGLVKLNRYFQYAKENHFLIIATGMSLKYWLKMFVQN